MLHTLPSLKVSLFKQTVREQIAARIAGMIQCGLLRIGDELPSERELATTLDVSRETVRGAIQMLAAIGMVQISQGARTKVVRADGFPSSPITESTDVSRFSAEEVYQARHLVELAVVREAAVRMNDSELARLRSLVKEQEEMTDDPVRFQISDVEFHELIYRSGGNGLLAAFLGEVYSYALAFRRKALLIPGAVTRSRQDHKRILKALEAHDPEAASTAMEQHLLRVHRTTLQAMELRAERAK